VIIVVKRFGERLKILEGQIVRSFFVRELAIVHGKTKTEDAEKIPLIGKPVKLFTEGS